MKRILAIGVLLVVLFGLSSCGGDYIQGEELFQLPQYISHLTIRHKGMGRYYVNNNTGETGADGLQLAKYNSLLKGLALTVTDQTGSLDAGIFELATSTIYYDEQDNLIVTDIKVIVSNDMVLYNNQWYEANTKWLLRQLERDFADAA